MKKRKAAAAGAPGRPKTVSDPTISKRLSVIICLLLALATLAIYAQTATHGYVAYDDDQYVYENHWVKAGLSAANVAWAFTTFFYANWHPLTWLSYMLDFSLWGPNAGAQHLTNVAFHLASTLLLFLALARMTKRPWRAALVAAIFTVHPLRVESVAWISELKNVLSLPLLLLAMNAHLDFDRTGKRRDRIPRKKLRQDFAHAQAGSPFDALRAGKQHGVLPNRRRA